MKTTKLILFFVLAAVYATQAAVYTVNNTPTTTIAQFSTIQAAVNACAASGDTVYVHGSPNSYSGFTITNKSIVLIGPGWSPDKAWGFVANVNTNSSVTGLLSSGTEIQGIDFSANLHINSTVPNNIRLIRNYFSAPLDLNAGSGLSYSNYTIEGNYFHNNQINFSVNSTYFNILFKNNVFYRSGGVSIASLNGPTNTVIFDHNLFFGPSSGSNDIFAASGYMMFTNNIFVRRNAGSNNSFSSFSNNITFHPPTTAANPQYDSPWTVNSNLDGGGNVSNQSPQMVAQASVNSGVSNPLLDFTIAAGPADNSGVDGKDMGLLYDVSGSANWANSRNSRLPRISNFIITNPNIPAGGTLNIQVEGKKSN